MKTFQKFLFASLVILFSFSIVNLNIDRSGSITVSNELMAQDNFSVWTDIPAQDISNGDPGRVYPVKYRSLKLNLSSFRVILDAAPFEQSDRALNSPFVIELPAPDGNLSRFYVTEYSMMEPGLAAQYPEIKTYSVKGIDDPYAVGKIDFTLFGFHGMVLTPGGDYFIEPMSLNNLENYISFYKTDFISSRLFECLVTEEALSPDAGSSFNFNMTGQQLRTYRLACAATGEYTAFFGGTVAQGQAAIVTSINRVNAIYERDLSVRMTLVANNSSLVYTNSGTDPYTNSNGSTMLTQNQNNITTVIGTANYDIGHVFSTGGGGVAGLGVVCNSTSKARGVTGSPSPVGDAYDIDYVAHEIGHQFSGNHSFNGNAGSCAGGNRNASTAWEPGSGSTIMGYAGICSPQDLQSNSDALFHSGNVIEITNFTQSGGGSSCPVVTNTGNTPPTVTISTRGFTIPISTPFALTGSATDAETPGALTYCWEEFDLGAAGAPTVPVGNAPIFRSFNPVSSPTRTFPKLSNLLNNTTNIGEILPTYTRVLKFRLAVRDNSAGGGGINFDTVTFNVNSGSGPFLVTSPNTSVTLNAGAQTVTWNVANTTAAPVNCSQVNIKLSTDGGVTFPTTLVSNTANDGSEGVTLPNISSTTARIKVESVGNVFFDISNINFTITNAVTPVPAAIKIAQEGYYDSLTNRLNIRDTVKFYLRNIVTPYAIVDSASGIVDSVTSTATVTFMNASTGTYYIAASGWNIIETWSKSGGESYTRGSVLNYDFTSASSQAYGNNLIQKGSIFCAYSGDVASKGTINLVDILTVTNAANIFTSGYNAYDLTGDRLVDLSDILITFNNSSNFVSRVAPPGAVFQNDPVNTSMLKSTAPDLIDRLSNKIR